MEVPQARDHTSSKSQCWRLGSCAPVTFSFIFLVIPHSLFPGRRVRGDWEGLNLFHFMFPWVLLLVHPRGTSWSQSQNCPSGQWSLLYTPITALVSDSSDYVVCPWSALLSAAGSLSFQDHISPIAAVPFKAPELLQGQSDEELSDASQVRWFGSSAAPLGLSRGNASF